MILIMQMCEVPGCEEGVDDYSDEGGAYCEKHMEMVTAIDDKNEELFEALERLLDAAIDNKPLPPPANLITECQRLRSKRDALVQIWESEQEGSRQSGVLTISPYSCTLTAGETP